jgi:hypothetical protein
MNKHDADVRRGRLMKREQSAGFKLVCVLGDAPRSPGRVRICVWSANQNQWSNPQTVDPDTLVPIYYAGLRATHRRVVDKAMQHIRQRQNTIKYTSGAFVVGDPWCADRNIKPKPTAGVTKLAPVTANTDRLSISPEGREKLQQLNKVLGDWAFGGKKP